MNHAIVTITLTERDSSAILGVLDNAAENGELNDAFSVTIEHHHGSEDTPRMSRERIRWPKRTARLLSTRRYSEI